MQLTFAEPAAALKRYVLTYYMVEDEGSISEDIHRADVGLLTFVLDGSGHYDFSAGKRVVATPVVLTGPTTLSFSFSAMGPLRFVGVSLGPDFWGGIADCSGSDFADHATEPTPLLPQSPAPIVAALRDRSTLQDMAPILDTWFLAMAKPVPDEQKKHIEIIRAWLSSQTFPDVADLYEQFDISERQVIRIANRYFGAPPKKLAGKYGALRTAAHIFMNNGDISDEMSMHYADRSHLIRAVKAVTGQTPKQLKSRSRPLLGITLQPQNYRELTGQP